MKSLTDYADCAGCASKFQAADLDLILDGLPRAHVDDRVLVDFGKRVAKSSLLPITATLKPCSIRARVSRIPRIR